MKMVTFTARHVRSVMLLVVCMAVGGHPSQCSMEMLLQHLP